MLKRSTLMLAVLLAETAFARNPKLAPELDVAGASGKRRVLVRYKTAPTTAHQTRAAGQGATFKSSLSQAGVSVYELPADKAAALAEDPDVAYVSPDRVVRGSLDYMPATVGADIALRYGWDGAAIGVAVIDSGVASSSDFLDSRNRTRVVYSENFLPLCSTPAGNQTQELAAMGAGTAAGTACVTKNSPVDEYGHGTHVAGIIGGSGKMSTGAGYTYTIRGVAPAVNIVNLRALDARGAGTDSVVIAAIDRAIALKSRYNIRVINLSLGRPVFESYQVDPLCQAAERAWQAGIVVVAAAGNMGRDNTWGNQGYGTIASPGNDPHVITVGSMRTMSTASRADDLIATYSSKGPSLVDRVVKPDLVAPGNGIDAVSCSNCTLMVSYSANKTPLQSYTSSQSGPSPYYFNMSGTSMATPVTAGTVALMLEKDPSLTPDQVKARLMKTAGKSFPASSTYTDPATGITYYSQYDIFTVGAGYLDAWAALNNTDRATRPATSPTVRINPTTGKVELVTGSNIVWGDNIIWGSNIIWGGCVIGGSNIVWGDSAPWGNASTSPYNIIWGGSVPPSQGGTSGNVELNGDR